MIAIIKTWKNLFCMTGNGKLLPSAKTAVIAVYTHTHIYMYICMYMYIIFAVLLLWEIKSVSFKTCSKRVKCKEWECECVQPLNIQKVLKCRRNFCTKHVIFITIFYVHTYLLFLIQWKKGWVVSTLSKTVKKVKICMYVCM